MSSKSYRREGSFHIGGLTLELKDLGLIIDGLSGSSTYINILADVSGIDETTLVNTLMTHDSDGLSAHKADKIAMFRTNTNNCVNCGFEYDGLYFPLEPFELMMNRTMKDAITEDRSLLPIYARTVNDISYDLDTVQAVGSFVSAGEHYYRDLKVIEKNLINSVLNAIDQSELNAVTDTRV